MMTMLYVLGVYDFKWPKYAADVKIELYQDKVCFFSPAYMNTCAYICKWKLGFNNS